MSPRHLKLKSQSKQQQQQLKNKNRKKKKTNKKKKKKKKTVTVTAATTTKTTTAKTTTRTRRTKTKSTMPPPPPLACRVISACNFLASETPWKPPQIVLAKMHRFLFGKSLWRRASCKPIRHAQTLTSYISPSPCFVPSMASDFRAKKTTSYGIYEGVRFSWFKHRLAQSHSKPLTCLQG